MKKAPGAQTNRLGQASAGEIFGLAAETHRLIFSNGENSVSPHSNSWRERRFARSHVVARTKLEALLKALCAHTPFWGTTRAQNSRGL